MDPLVQLKNLHIMIKKTKAIEKLESALSDVRTEFTNMKENREAIFDDKSDTWKEGEKGEEEQENIDGLEEIVDLLDEVETKVSDLFGGF